MYVHIPFCASRCDYCDFATWTDRGHLIDAYVDAVLVDLRRHSDAPAATSVFFGGGTPSLLPAESLVAILNGIDTTPGAEVTVECNPDSIDRNKLEQYAAAGVNRISLGVQSMRAHVLDALGRTHIPENVAKAVADARDVGIDRISLDLIYGTPGESFDDWKATLDDALALEPQHISAYALTVESGTPLGRRIASGGFPATDDDDQATKYELADDRLHAAGYRWYEISNWARPGEQCRHNILYWSSGDYLAIGCAAHGHRDGRRWWNVRTPERYIEAITTGRSPEAGAEELDGPARAEEALALALRMASGIDAGSSRGPIDEVIADLVAGGMVQRCAGDRIVLTRPGRLLATDVTARLLLAGVGTR